MFEGRVLRFILQMGSDSNISGWSLVRCDPSIPSEFRSGSTSMSGISDQPLIMVGDLFSSGLEVFYRVCYLMNN